MKKGESSIKMALTFSNRRGSMEEKIDAKAVSEKAKGYFDQGYN